MVETQEQAPITEEEKIILRTIGDVEKVVNEYASSLCVKYGLKPYMFHINLHTRLRGDMIIRRGITAQVDLLWPKSKNNINSLLGRAFSEIVRRKLKESVELSVWSSKKARREVIRKWMSEYTDVAVDIPDLIPINELIGSTLYEYTLTHKSTKLSVTIKYDDGRLSGDVFEEARLKLSRLVLLNEVEDDDGTDS